MDKKAHHNIFELILLHAPDIRYTTSNATVMFDLNSFDTELLKKISEFMNNYKQHQAYNKNMDKSYDEAKTIVDIINNVS